MTPEEETNPEKKYRDENECVLESSNVEMLCFSEFLHACLSDFTTADTTVGPQSEIQWHNNPSFFF